MKAVRITEDIYWVGAIDWDIRNFHGYITRRGTTYNAYLIMDEKITLVDTVKASFFPEMMSRISSVVDPAKIDYVISNHVEMDHSGSLPELMEVAGEATVFTSPKGQAGLSSHYRHNWELRVVKSGESLNLGKRKIQFLQTPMVHWPDNMVSFLAEDKILFSNDAFGQHLASFERFNDELPLHMVLEEAKKYYANIVLPYGRQVAKTLQEVEKLDIDIIAPSHGVVWRSHLSEIVERYGKWSANQTEDSAVIVFDTMWDSTGKLAEAVFSAFEKAGIPAKIRHLKTNHISDIMTDVLTSKYICVGSSTLNNNMLPSVAAFLTYLKGLAPRNRVGLAFGSYGWGGQSVGQVEEVLRECGFDILNQIKVQYVPDEDFLANATAVLSEELMKRQDEE